MQLLMLETLPVRCDYVLFLQLAEVPHASYVRQ
jgi:hypothetical protein